MARIHHMTTKLAAKHGLNVVENGDSFEVRTNEGNFLVDAASDPKAALKAAIELIKGDDEDGDYEEALSAFIEAASDEDDEDAEEGGNGKSIVKRSYKKAYKPFKNTCGDAFTDLMDKAVKVSVKIDGKKTVKRVDEAKLRKLARLNGAWVEGYENLNVGQQRMSVGNRLRAMVKKGVEIKWI